MERGSTSAETARARTAGRASARSPRPTIKDVAAHAGVAFKTVSRVVNNEAGVSDETRELVQASIEALGFRRNASAASLRQRQTSSIALVLEDVAEPIQGMIARTVEQQALLRGNLLFTASSSDDPARERNLLLSLGARPVDGLIVVPSSEDHAYLAQEVDAGMPVVFIDRPAIGIEADTVLSDNRDGARQGVQHLIAHGHRRIAFIGDERNVYTSSERYVGYCEALQASGIPYDPALVLLNHHDPARIAEHVAAIGSLADPATAIFTVNSLNTLGTLRALGPGHRLALVAFDDLELFDLLTPPVTAVAQDPEQMAVLATEMLFERIAGDSSPARTKLVRTSLIERGSGEVWWSSR